MFRTFKKIDEMSVVICLSRHEILVGSAALLTVIITVDYFITVDYYFFTVYFFTIFFFFFFFFFFFLIQFYVPFKIISAHMRQANQ